MSKLTNEHTENALFGFITFSDAGTITSVNQTLVSLLGYHEKTEMIGRHIEMIFTVAGRMYYQTHFFPTIRLHGKADQIFLTLKGKIKNIPVVCNATRNEEHINRCFLFPTPQKNTHDRGPLPEKNLADHDLFKNMEEASANRELETFSIELDRKLRELKQANEDLNRFREIITNDLREPMDEIAMFSSKVAKENKSILDDSSMMDLYKIITAGEKINNIFTNFRAFIRLDIKKEKILKIDLNAVVKKVLKKIVQYKGITNAVLKIDPLCNIEGYPSQIEALFFNIINNCFQYKDSSKPSEIMLEMCLVQKNMDKGIRNKYVDFIEITISDNGRSVTHGKQNYINTIGQDQDREPLNSGLEVCNKIVKTHHGTVSIDNVGGRWTRVKVLLPTEQQK